MKYFKKRTDEEIYESLKEDDFTGGYKFLPWIYHNHRWYILYVLFLFLMGYQTLEEYFMYGSILGLAIFIICVIALPGLVFHLLYRNYYYKKKGKNL